MHCNSTNPNPANRGVMYESQGVRVMYRVHGNLRSPDVYEIMR